MKEDFEEQSRYEIGQVVWYLDPPRELRPGELPPVSREPEFSKKARILGIEERPEGTFVCLEGKSGILYHLDAIRPVK